MVVVVQVQEKMRKDEETLRLEEVQVVQPSVDHTQAAEDKIRKKATLSFTEGNSECERTPTGTSQRAGEMSGRTGEEEGPVCQTEGKIQGADQGSPPAWNVSLHT